MVGVVADVRSNLTERTPHPLMYLSYSQDTGRFLNRALRPRDLAIRVQGDRRPMSIRVRSAIWGIDSQEPVARVQVMQQLVDENLASFALEAKLFFGLPEFRCCLHPSESMD